MKLVLFERDSVVRPGAIVASRCGAAHPSVSRDEPRGDRREPPSGVIGRELAFELLKPAIVDRHACAH